MWRHVFGRISFIWKLPENFVNGGGKGAASRTPLLLPLAGFFLFKSIATFDISIDKKFITMASIMAALSAICCESLNRFWQFKVKLSYFMFLFKKISVGLLFQSRTTKCISFHRNARNFQTLCSLLILLLSLRSAAQPMTDEVDWTAVDYYQNIIAKICVSPHTLRCHSPSNAR